MPDNNNKSLYIYTGLIFLVAVILIIVSFFGQSKLEKKQPIPVSQEEVSSITERASVLSSENKTLLEENLSLKKQLDEQRSAAAQYGAQLEIYKRGYENVALLTKASSLCASKKYTQSREILNSVDTSIMSEDEKMIYENINKTLENNGK